MQFICDTSKQEVKRSQSFAAALLSSASRQSDDTWMMPMEVTQTQTRRRRMVKRKTTRASDREDVRVVSSQRCTCADASWTLAQVDGQGQVDVVFTLPLPTGPVEGQLGVIAPVEIGSWWGRREG